MGADGLLIARIRARRRPKFLPVAFQFLRSRLSLLGVNHQTPRAALPNVVATKANLPKIFIRVLSSPTHADSQDLFESTPN